MRMMTATQLNTELYPAVGVSADDEALMTKEAFYTKI